MNKYIILAVIASVAVWAVCADTNTLEIGRASFRFCDTNEYPNILPLAITNSLEWVAFTNRIAAQAGKDVAK